jgi:hypothetical protein
MTAEALMMRGAPARGRRSAPGCRPRCRARTSPFR